MDDAEKTTAEKIWERSKADPVWWVKEFLGVTLWEKQCEIAESVRDNKRTSVRSCHGAGKTFDAAMLVLWFLFAHPNSRVITTAPTFRQVEKVLWQEIRKAHKAAKVPLGGDLTLTQLKIDDGWFAFGFSTDDPDSMQGQHARSILVVLDEASGIKKPIFQGADALLTSDNARFLAIGNPTDPLGDFCQSFKDAGTHKISISAFDTPNFTKFKIKPEDCMNGRYREKIRNAREAHEKLTSEDWPGLPIPELVTPDWVADAFRRYGVDSPWCVARVFGNFPIDAEDVLIPLSWIEAACNRTLVPTGLDPIELGCDISSSGKDETVFYKRHGPVARCIYSKFPPPGGKIRTMNTARKIKELLEECGGSYAKVDGIAVGVGVVDKLAEIGCPHEDVQFGASARDSDRFLNLRAETYWGLRELFEYDNIDIDPDDEVLIAQLASIKWDTTPAGKIRIEPKEKMPKSPDRADALAIAYSGGGAEVHQDRDYRMGPSMQSANPW